MAGEARDGFIVLPDILEPAQVETLRRVTDRFVDNARSVAANDEIYDFEESHSPDAPRVRRIKRRICTIPNTRGPPVTQGSSRYYRICGARCALTLASST